MSPVYFFWFCVLPPFMVAGPVINGTVQASRRLTENNIRGCLYRRHMSITVAQLLASAAVIIWTFHECYRLGHFARWKIVALALYLLASQVVSRWHEAAVKRDVQNLRT